MQMALRAVVFYVGAVLEVASAVLLALQAGKVVTPSARAASATPCAVGAETQLQDMASSVDPVPAVVVRTQEGRAGRI